MAASSMNAIAEQFADQKVGSIFLYTNEAHPGENYPHHTSFEQKLQQAQALRDVYGVDRPIVVDALAGACHLAFGGMPNMTWIFTRAGLPVYKSNWTDSGSVANMLDYLMQIKQRRRDGERVAPFMVERIDYRTKDEEGFYAGLARSGPKAVTEFDTAFE
jgi:hypothetical protein